MMLLVASIPMLQVYAQPPDTLVLQNTTITTSAIFEARFTIAAGPNFRIAGTGDATLRTGGDIYFRPAIAVAHGGKLRTISDQTLLSVRALETNIPVKFELQQNYPNPFNPTTQIRFAVKEKSRVTLVVYNLLGQSVTTLVNEELPAGEYEAHFAPSALPSGVYVYRMTTSGFILSRSMLLLK